MSRTGTFFVRLAVLLSLATLLACAAPEPPHEKADLVLRGGKVVTVDASRPEAQAVAARGGRIVAVGSDAEIAPWIGPETRVVELGGRLAVPGFIESHGHFMGLGTSKTILDLRQAATWDEIVAMVGEAAAAAEPGAWIRGRGWHQEKWTAPPSPAVEGAPVHASLSAVSPDHPVILTHASGHASFVNAKALELAGIGRGSKDPPGGQIVRDAAGQPTGLLRETAQRLVRAVESQSREGRPPEEIEAEQRRLVELASQEALSKGVTSFQDAGSSFATEGALALRLYVMVRYASNEEMAEKLPFYRSVVEGDDYLTVRAIKRQIDGALGPHGAWLLEPYEDLPESVGLVLEPEDEIRRTAELAVEHGYQLNTHAIGDRGNRRVLDIYQEVMKAQGVADPSSLRWRIEHAQHLHPDDVGRFAELGIVASMQGVHCTSDGPWVLRRLGEERARSGAYLWRELLDRGVVIANGTDVPVEDIDPLASFYSSVTRITPQGDAFFPDQKMTREEALTSYTLNGAFAAFEEDVKGSIAVGKLADLVVLSRDVMTIPEEEIPETRVDLTIVGGKVRYERGG
jgi:hypothetical protein